LRKRPTPPYQAPAGPTDKSIMLLLQNPSTTSSWEKECGEVLGRIFCWIIRGPCTSLRGNSTRHPPKNYGSQRTSTYPPKRLRDPSICLDISGRGKTSLSCREIPLLKGEGPHPDGRKTAARTVLASWTTPTPPLIFLCLSTSVDREGFCCRIFIRLLNLQPPGLFAGEAYLS